MKTLFCCRPEKFEVKITAALEYFGLENKEDLEEGQEVDIEIETREVEEDYNGGMFRHTYTDAFDWELDQLVDYLNEYFGVKFNVTNL